MVNLLKSYRQKISYKYHGFREQCETAQICPSPAVKLERTCSQSSPALQQLPISAITRASTGPTWSKSPLEPSRFATSPFLTGSMRSVGTVRRRVNECLAGCKPAKCLEQGTDPALAVLNEHAACSFVVVFHRAADVACSVAPASACLQWCPPLCLSPCTTDPALAVIFQQVQLSY